MSQVSVFESGSRRYAIDPASQAVAHPQRATMTFASEARKRAGIQLASAFGALVGLPALALLFFFIDRRTQGDAFPGNLLGAALLLATPFVFGGLVREAWRALRLPGRTSNRSTAQGTVEGFFKALGVGAWANAYNHLTDTAQGEGPVDLPLDTYLQKAMPTPPFGSLDAFKEFWRRVLTGTQDVVWKPDLSSLQDRTVDPQTTMVEVTFEAVPTSQDGAFASQLRAAGLQSQFFFWRFAIIERGGFWFLCNGFFWPIESPTKT